MNTTTKPPVEMPRDVLKALDRLLDYAAYDEMRHSCLARHPPPAGAGGRAGGGNRMKPRIRLKQRAYYTARFLCWKLARKCGAA